MLRYECPKCRRLFIDKNDYRISIYKNDYSTPRNIIIGHKIKTFIPGCPRCKRKGEPIPKEITKLALAGRFISAIGFIIMMIKGGPYHK